METKKIIATLVVVALVVSASAIVVVNQLNKPKEITDEERENDSTHYPVTVTTMDNNRKLVDMVYKKCPTRVICTNQMQSEVMLYFGLESYIVGVAYLDNGVLPEFQAKYNKLNQMTETGYPKLEDCVALKPDLILGWRTAFADKALGSVNTWTPRNCNCYVVDQSANIDEVLQVIDNIGKIFNIEDKTSKYTADAKAKLSAIDGKVKSKGAPAPNVLILELDSKTKEVTPYGGLSLVGTSVVLAGGKNAYPSEKYPGVSGEDIRNLNPDKIVIIHYGKVDDTVEPINAVNSVKNYEGWSGMDAVKEKDRIMPLGLTDLWGGGIRFVDAVEKIYEFLYA